MHRSVHFVLQGRGSYKLTSDDGDDDGSLTTTLYLPKRSDSTAASHKANSVKFPIVIIKSFHWSLNFQVIPRAASPDVSAHPAICIALNKNIHHTWVLCLIGYKGSEGAGYHLVSCRVSTLNHNVRSNR